MRARAALVAAAIVTGLLVAPTCAAAVAESTRTLTMTLPAAHAPHADPASTSRQPSSATYTDPRGDVWKYDDPDQTQLDAKPAPGLVPSDVIRTRFKHMHTRVRVRILFADLQQPALFNGPMPDGTIFAIRVWVYVATSQGNGQYIAMDISHNGARKVTMHPFVGHGRTPCATSHAINYAEDWIRIGFPRACLGDPEWVRLGVVDVAQGTPDLHCFDDVMTEGFAYATRSFYAVRLSTRLYQA